MQVVGTGWENGKALGTVETGFEGNHSCKILGRRHGTVTTRCSGIFVVFAEIQVEVGKFLGRDAEMDLLARATTQ